eukprot:m.110556 g.110556  ORF g.110556 m.110556 type:complete len:703 (+) comp37405_c0_seq10:35-2143(+)
MTAIAVDLDVCEQEYGRLWLRNPSCFQRDVPFLRVFRSERNMRGPSRQILFSAVAVNRSNSSFAAADRLGRLYTFRPSENVFSFVINLGMAFTALCYENKRIVAGLVDHSVRIIDVERKEVTGELGQQRKSSVRSISLHSASALESNQPPHPQLALICTAIEVDLWDLRTLVKRRSLRGLGSIGIVKASFLFDGARIMTCFRDDTIVLWNTDSLQYRCLLRPPTTKPCSLQCICEMPKVEMLVAGGRAPFLYFWSLSEQRLVQLLHLPHDNFREISNIDTVQNRRGTTDESNEILLVLAVNTIYFINVKTLTVLSSVGKNDISKFFINTTGKYLLAVRDSRSLELYSLHKTTGSQPSFGAATASGGFSRAIGLCQLMPVLSPSGYPAIDSDRLRSVLGVYGHYPSTYRTFIWSSLLQLPTNHSAYQSLLRKGDMPLAGVWPIPSRRLLKAFTSDLCHRTLSALFRLCPLFSQVHYLPFLIFPFVKAFNKNPLLAFEISATVVKNWAKLWFEYFPNPPITILNLIENLLCHHDNSLLHHFSQMKVTAQLYAWPLMQSLLSEVLLKQEWLQLWDHLFSHHPSYLLYAVVAYLVVCRSVLLKCQSPDDVEQALKRQLSVNINTLVKEMRVIQKTTPEALKPEQLLDSFESLSSTKGDEEEGRQTNDYSLSIKFPKFSSDFLARERKKLRDEELQYLSTKNGLCSV